AEARRHAPIGPSFDIDTSRGAPLARGNGAVTTHRERAPSGRGLRHGARPLLLFTGAPGRSAAAAARPSAARPVAPEEEESQQTMDRRNFIKGATAGSIGLAMSRPLETLAAGRAGKPNIL